jgi:hypothetical protein
MLVHGKGELTIAKSKSLSLSYSVVVSLSLELIIRTDDIIKKNDAWIDIYS